ncbi:MAG: hypothetical protein HY796_06800 [Elusimicrobia bacterium]|nr:hypothetical protein [Elusimicrobiota bacterium]
MRKKANSIILTIIAAIIVTLPHAPKIVTGGNPLLAAAAIAVVVSIPPNCDASVIEQLCSSVTGFLDDEGKGGQVTDLKSSEPGLSKTSPASEFSLSGKILSGEASEPYIAYNC